MIHIGSLNEAQAAFISLASHADPVLRENVPDDADRRFTTATMAGEYLFSDDRRHYLLVEDEDPNTVQGIVWIKPIGNKEHTFAIRMYESGRGKNLAMNFAQTAISEYLSHLPDSEYVVLDVKADNDSAISLYRKLGFVCTGVYEADHEPRIKMSLERE